MKIKNFFKTKQGKIIIAVAGIIILFLIIIKVSGGKQSQEYYEVAVIIDDTNYVKNEKTSKKVGDVIAVHDKDFAWSDLDKSKYLILKMDINDEEAKNLSIANQREIKYDDLSDEEKEEIKKQEDLAKENGEDYVYEPRMELIAVRKYAIDLSKLGNISSIDLVRKGQPFFDKIYKSDIIIDRK